MNHTIILKSGDKSHTTLANRPLAKFPYSHIIILIHGFPDDNTSFNEVGGILTKQFPKALIVSPLLRGYEPSSYHDFSQYKTSDLALDIKNWIEDIQTKTASTAKVTLVGHDWGAIAAMKAASLYPDIISSVVSLAIPYVTNVHLHHLLYYCPEQLYYSTYFLTMQHKWFYSKLEQIGSNSYLNYLWKFWSPTWNFDSDDILHVRQTLTPTTIDHTTAYYRCLLNPLNVRNARWHIDFNKVPVYILGGKDDHCMTYRLYELEEKLLKNEKNAKVELVPGIGHFLHREDPKTVAKLIIEWVNGH